MRFRGERQRKREGERGTEMLVTAFQLLELTDRKVIKKREESFMQENSFSATLFVSNVHQA